MAFEDLKFEMSSAELHTMNEVWANPGAASKLIAFNLYQKYDWAPSTSYTLLARCAKKGFAAKDEAGCWHPIIEKETVQKQRLQTLTADLYGGSALDMACALVEKGFIAQGDLEKLKQTLAQMG